MRMVGGAPWLNPQTKKPMTKIGFTCAACHTGRLTYQQTTLLVDGGPALTDLGKFRQALGISVLFTKLVPWPLSIASLTNVLGEDAERRGQGRAYASSSTRSGTSSMSCGSSTRRSLDASVDEGYGRLDALNRIGNQVFGLDLGKEGRKRTTPPRSAPVNFPHLWNTSWFDWVQYNASIQQPMVRNAGEALGVSAPRQPDLEGRAVHLGRAGGEDSTTWSSSLPESSRTRERL